MFYTSRNIADQRDRILFGERYESKKYSGGIRYFDDLDYDRLKTLLDQKLADLEEQHNCAPEIGEIAEFLDKHKNFTAHGYAVSPERDDFRVSLEGVECGDEYSKQDMLDFVELFRFADEFSIDDTGMYCWFD